MPFFDYKAKTSAGQLQTGKVEAVSLSKAAETIQEKGLFLISLTPVKQDWLSSFNQKLSKVKFEDVVIFTRQLASMVEAGLTLTTAISLLMEQSKPNVRVVLNQILNDLEGGQSLSQALAKHEKIFPKTYVFLVEAGESSGSLDVVLNRLADTLEEQKDFQGKVTGALVYPTAVLLVMIVVAIVMMVVVVPKLLEVFQEFDAKLPLPTLILIGISSFLTNYWWAILILLLGATIGFFAWYRNPDSKRIVDRLMFKVPILGNLRQKTILANYNQTLAMLIKSGIPLVESLHLTSESVSSITYRDHLREIEDKVEKGLSFGVALSSYDDFPPIMAQMVKVGQETGKLDSVLFRLAKYFKSESERAVSGLMAAFEPIIMVILGIGVAFLVIAVILPIYDLTNQISS